MNLKLRVFLILLIFMVPLAGQLILSVRFYNAGDFVGTVIYLIAFITFAIVVFFLVIKNHLLGLEK